MAKQSVDEERQRKSLYLTAMWELAEQICGVQAVPGDVDPLLVRARKDIDRWWPLLKDRHDRGQIVGRSEEVTLNADAYEPWPYFRKVMNRLIAQEERVDPGIVKSAESHCHVHGWYPMREMAAHTDCSYDEGETR